MNRTIRNAVMAAAFAAWGVGVMAQNAHVTDAWARATVPGQKATGTFMKISATENLKLVDVRSPAAGVVQVHEMKMDGDVMKMRPVPTLDIAAGTSIELKPGGFHIMLMDLKAPLLKGSKLPMTLVFKDAKGLESRVELSVPVASGFPVEMQHHH